MVEAARRGVNGAEASGAGRNTSGPEDGAQPPLPHNPVLQLSCVLLGSFAMINRNGANFRAALPAMSDFHQVAAVGDLALGASMLVELEGRKIALVRSAAGYRAVDDFCTHVGGRLHQGALEGEEIVCPWHAARFSLSDGEVREGPGRCALESFRVRVVNGFIEVEVPPAERTALFGAPRPPALAADLA